MRTGLITRLKSGAMFLLLLALLAVVFYFQRGTPPFSAVAGRSMEPTFRLGDLVLITPVAPSEVREADVVVVRVPQAVRDFYHYPPAIVHRVTRVESSGASVTFRIQGDNNPGEDPFTVLPGDIQGTVVRTIPYLGYLILFFQSQQGLAFALAAIAIYFLYVVSEVVENKGRGLVKTASRALASELVTQTQEIERRQEQSQEIVSGSLINFAYAMNEYAMHLSSHTEAVKSLAESAKYLRESARSQNQVFENLSGLLSRPPKAADQGFEELLRRPSRDVDGLETIYTEVLRTRAAVEEVESAMRDHIEHLRRQNVELKSEIHDLSSAIHSLVAVMQASSEQPHPVTAERSSPPGFREHDNPLPSAAASSNAGVDNQVKDVGVSNQPDNAIFGDCPLPPRSQRKRRVSSA
jgi:signal peptidase I